MCLAIACAAQPTGAEALPTVREHGRNLPLSVDPNVAMAAGREFFRHGGHPLQSDQFLPYSMDASGQQPPGVFRDHYLEFFSGCHNGLALYFSRILRPVWTLPLTNVYQGDLAKQDTRLTAQHFHELEYKLAALKAFLDKSMRSVLAHAFMELTHCQIQISL